jgi:hypothetical protein
VPNEEKRSSSSFHEPELKSHIDILHLPPDNRAGGLRVVLSERQKAARASLRKGVWPHPEQRRPPDMCFSVYDETNTPCSLGCRTRARRA